jgi:hypothetical protein
MTARRRMHWVDAAVVALLLAVTATTLAGVRAMNGTEPKIDALAPRVVAPGVATRLRLSGRDLRPYLQIFVAPGGTPFVLRGAVIPNVAAPFYFAGTRDAEIELPALRPGGYDLYVYDQGRRVAAVTSAIRVEAGPPHRATASALIRFFVADESIPLVKVGDRDRRASSAPESTAVITRVAAGVATETIDLREIGPKAYGGVRLRSRVLDATLAIPVTENDDRAWIYDGMAVRAGEDFTFATDRYVLRGVTVDVDVPK